MSSGFRPYHVLCAILACVSLHADRLRVATWNLENYTLTDRMTPDGWVRDAPKPEKEKTALRMMLRKLRADVLVVQEIGGPAFVGELRRDLASEGLSYPYEACVEGPDPHRRIAILSKRPLFGILREARIETTSPVPSPHERVALVNRGLLGARVATPSGPLTIYGVHLKSRLTRDPRDPRGETERLAESDAVRSLIGNLSAASDHPLVLLCGDFNDGPQSPAVTRFGTFSGKPFLIRLDPVDAAGESWTYRNDKKGFMNRSDYLFVSPALKPFVVRTHAPVDPLPGLASDHRPVVADFDFQDKK